tara:strand:+ start:544 stop:654 length:111 start_codon:yes stop_codon:yes gene_type:complete
MVQFGLFGLVCRFHQEKKFLLAFAWKKFIQANLRNP